MSFSDRGGYWPVSVGAQSSSGESIAAFCRVFHPAWILFLAGHVAFRVRFSCHNQSTRFVMSMHTFLMTTTVQAEIILQPPALESGDRYRLVFVTSEAVG